MDSSSDKRLYQIALTMIPGSLLGGWLSNKYGQSIVIDGKAGTIPPALIFQVAAGLVLLALIPLLIIRRRAKNGKSTASLEK